MGIIGNQPVPGFVDFQRALEQAHETAELEIVTVSKAVFKVKRGSVQFNNGVLTVPHGDRLAIIPAAAAAVDHVLFRP